MEPTSLSDLPSLPDQTPSSVGDNVYLRRLSEDSKRLFSSSKVEVEALCWNEGDDGQR
jgi:hypothetical protein